MSEQSCKVRVGTVTAVNNGKLLARVKFDDLVDAAGQSMTSDWLPVVVNQPFIPGYEGQQRTEYAGGGSGDAAYESHAHGLTIKPWMPKVNDQVLCLYDGVFNGQGYVLGGVKPWR